MSSKSPSPRSTSSPPRSPHAKARGHGDSHLLFEWWVKQAREREAAHLEVAMYFNKLYRWLTIPTIITSAIASSIALFLTGGADVGGTDLVLLGFITALNCLTTIGVTILATFRYSTVAENHRQSAVAFSSIARELDAQLFLPASKRLDPDFALEMYSQRFDDTLSSAPPLMNMGPLDRATFVRSIAT